MEKNPKSESYILKQAEQVIESYLKRRENENDNNNSKLKEKYERLKILTIAMFIVTAVETLINVVF